MVRCKLEEGEGVLALGIQGLERISVLTDDFRVRHPRRDVGRVSGAQWRRRGKRESSARGGRSVLERGRNSNRDSDRGSEGKRGSTAEN